MTRALITGAAGFVGGHLLSHLEASGDDVLTTDLSADGTDICDFDAVSALVRRTDPEAVYHLAGWSDVGGSWGNPQATFEANVIGTDTVLRACAAQRVERVLVVTSADVYGSVQPQAQPIKETAPLLPESPYAASKAAAELVAIQAGLGYGLDVVRARAFNHAGPGQRNNFVIPALADRLLACISSGETKLPVGSLTPTRDFTDVRDVVAAYRVLVESGVAGEAYNVCSGQDVAIASVLDELISLTGANVTPEQDPALIRPVDVPRRLGDPTKLHSATGWTPTIELTQTLRDVLTDRRSKQYQA